MKNKFLGIKIPFVFDVTALKMLVSIIAIAWASIMTNAINSTLEKSTFNEVQNLRSSLHFKSKTSGIVSAETSLMP